MGELDRFAGPIDKSGAGKRDLDRRQSLAVAGRRIEYESRDFDKNHSWALLSPSTLEWAQEVAGQEISDPHTGHSQFYWNCQIRRFGYATGPGIDPFAAAYDLWLFGRSGLAVASGTTRRLVEEPGETLWKNKRYPLKLDESRVRSDHLSHGTPNTQKVGQERRGTAPIRVPQRSFVPTNISSYFGNLPERTQEFVLEPFKREDRPPQQGDLDASIDASNGRCTETLMCYLFSSRWVSFVVASRSVAYQGTAGADLWSNSPERDELQSSLWQVAAWSLPVSRPGKEVAKKQER